MLKPAAAKISIGTTATMFVQKMALRSFHKGWAFDSVGLRNSHLDSAGTRNSDT